jgi:hypothetical protein
MTIGRISGPMLVPNLERQGINLSFDGNLVYLDVTQRRVGINTSTPTVELDVAGSANISLHANIGGNLYVGGGNVTVGSLYSLPTTAPLGPGQTIYSLGNDTLETVWGPGDPEGAIRRRKFERTYDGLLGYGYLDFELNLGISVIVYGITVSRPVKIEVFGTPDRGEPNPYTFIATPDHLHDDGTVVLNDGSSFQSRQYSIFANLEEPPKPNVYVRMSSLSSYLAATPVTLTLYYYPGVTDSRPGMEILEFLPTVAYEGKTVFLSTVNRLFIFAQGQWVPI